jgi:hypothetical protein
LFSLLWHAYKKLRLLARKKAAVFFCALQSPKEIEETYGFDKTAFLINRFCQNLRFLSRRFFEAKRNLPSAGRKGADYQKKLRFFKKREAFFLRISKPTFSKKLCFFVRFASKKLCFFVRFASKKLCFFETVGF